MKNLSHSSRNAGLNNQPIYILLIALVGFFLIIFRLLNLQIIQKDKFKRMSEENRIRLIANPPIRGRILDINNNVLANSRLAYSIFLKPDSLSDEQANQNIQSLAKLINYPLIELQNNYLNGKKKNDLQILLVQDLAIDQVLKFKEREDEFNGLRLNIKQIRNYPYNTLASHVLGYTQPITSKEYSLLSKQGYRINDSIGRSGVEAAYESYLRGKWGGEMIEVDASGSFQQTIGYRAPKSGKDLKLTLDLRLQLAAEEALADKKAGAIIAIDPRNGAIRALASKPNFDPNFFSKEFLPQKEYDYLFFSAGKPLMSRALNAYDPGSTWKVITAIAGLESGLYPEDTILETKPCIQYGSHCFPEHNKLGFGFIGYEDALRVSSNTFFYQVGVGSGVDNIYKYARMFGFGDLTGIEIGAEESKGFVANKKWAEKGRGWGEAGRTPWIPEDIASMSIGQAVIQVTPLQLARAYAAIANGGYLVTPHLAITNKSKFLEDSKQKLDITDSSLNVIRQGLLKVVQSGTGRAINFEINGLPPTAGKTGTAEDSTGGKDHAWFACFTPFEDSQIVVIAFAQNTPGGGSVHALPMARKILKEWLSIQ